MAENLNWLSNLNFNKGTPVDLNPVELKKASNDLRELNRQRALQKATAEGLKPSGELDYNLVRKSLAEQGFGESADKLVGEIQSTRESAANLESSSRNRDYLDMIKGLMSPDEFIKRHQGAEKTTVTHLTAPSSSYNLLTDKDIPGNFETPKTAVDQLKPYLPTNPNEIVVEGRTGMTPTPSGKLSDIGVQNEYKLEKTPAQITPDYLTSDIDIKKLLESGGLGIGGGSSIKYELPKDIEEANLSIKAAKSLLGTEFDEKDPKIAEKIDSRMDDIVKAKNPELPLVAFKDYQEYVKYNSELPGKIAKEKADLIDKFEAARNARIGQGFTERSTTTGEKGQKVSEAAQKVSEEAQKRTTAQVSHPAIEGVLPSPTEKAALTDASAAVTSMQSIIKDAPSPNGSEWNSFKLILGKDLIKAYNLPVGEGLLQEVSEMVKSGISMNEISDKLEKNGLKKGAADFVLSLGKSFAGLTTIDGAKYLVKQATDFSRGKWGAYGQGKDFDKFFPEYNYKPLLGQATPLPENKGLGQKPKTAADQLKSYQKKSSEKKPLSGMKF